MLELVHEVLEEAHEVFGLGVALFVEEQQHVLRRTHLLLVVVPCEFVEFLRFLGLAVRLQLVLLGLPDKLVEPLERVRRRRNIEYVVLPIDRQYILLIVHSEGPQGRLVLLVLPLNEKPATSIWMKLTSGSCWASSLSSFLVFLLPCLLK